MSRPPSESPPVDAALLAELATFSTPSVLNGLKRLGLAPSQLETMNRNVVSCTSPELGARAGLAATRIVATRRSGGPPDEAATLALTERSEAQIRALSGPAFLVVENVGDWRGPVCIWGEVTAHQNLALGCVAGVTNGPVRDVEEMAALGFQTFSGGPAVGGGFIDLLEVGVPVTVAGVRVEPGDLLHGDRHGIVRVPLALAPELPAAIRAHEAVERRVMAVCDSPDYSARAFLDGWT